MSRGSFKSFTPEERQWIRKSYAVLGQPYGSPYDICPHDWTPYMSPIEDNLWRDIRTNVPQAFLWQYPCGPYFIDFASPKLKIALEVDGRQYHTDHWKDWLRDQFLLTHGYDMIFHIPGFTTFQELCIEPNGDEEEYEDGEFVRPRVVLRVMADGGFMKYIRQTGEVKNPYHSPFTYEFTYQEFMAYISEKAWRVLPDRGETRKFGSVYDYHERATVYLKKAADACFCGKSWWLKHA